MTSSPNLVCAKCGHDGFTVAFLSPAEYAAPGQPRQMNIPPSTAAEAEIQEKLKRMEDSIKRDVGERVLSGIDPSVLGRLAAFHTRLERLEKDQKHAEPRLKQVDHLARCLDGLAPRVEALEDGYHAMQRTSARELSEQVKRNVGFDRRLGALEKREPGQHGWPEIRAELSRIGTRQFDAGRRLEIVSESCAEARKEARQARWLAFLCAVVLLGLSFAVALGKAA